MASARKKVNPEELGADFFRRAKRGLAHVPAPIRKAIDEQRRGRGPQKAPTKEQITLRLSPDVVKAYRSTGRGWHGRIDADLQVAARRIRARKTARAS